MAFKRNLSPAVRESHYRSLIGMFARDVHVVTEWRDGAVYRTKPVGQVVFFPSDRPFKKGSGAS